MGGLPWQVKNLPAMQKTRVQSLGWEDLLEKGMATHSSIRAWRITWTEEPGGPQSMGWQRLGHDWATSPVPSPSCMSLQALPVSFVLPECPSVLGILSQAVSRCPGEASGSGRVPNTRTEGFPWVFLSWACGQRPPALTASPPTPTGVWAARRSSQASRSRWAGPTSTRSSSWAWSSRSRARWAAGGPAGRTQLLLRPGPLVPGRGIWTVAVETHQLGRDSQGLEPSLFPPLSFSSG